ncbi:MAG: DedA family protein [Bacteroidia bacterium]|nr:DedA family protein [Bacteroidia bacterium]MCZ2277975.1 DedA family protein [Bacteroidia bacterium]
MEHLKFLIDFILHIDRHLFELVQQYDTWIYLILFLIVFAETGLVVTPLLPGDSLLFAAGTLAAPPDNPLNVTILIIIFFSAAFGGDNTNYFIGNYIGPKVFEKNYRLLKKEYLHKTQAFYARHGGKAVILARFVPIVRTFAPFVAGVGSMAYKRFIGFSLLASLLWINICVWAGYFFGKLEIVKNNFSIVVFAIIGISLLPILIGFLKHKFSKA